jgi:molybdenum cofactor cytidylyltransferase
MTNRPSPTIPPADTVAVLLAAGGGTRFASSAVARSLPVTHKLLAPLKGRTVFQCALSNVLDAGFASVLVVSGAASLPLVGLPSTVEVVHNARWADGQATSLALAIDTVRDRAEVRRIVVGLGDQPFIPAETWASIASQHPDVPILVATYEGKRRNPVRLDRTVWELVPRDGDEGARPLFRSHAHLVTELACQGDPADIDTAEDLLRWS